MDKFPETYNLPRLNKEEIDNLNRPDTFIKIKSIIKKRPTNRSPGLGGFTGEFYQTYKEKLILTPLKLWQKIEEKAVLPNSFCGTTIILIPKSDKDTTKKKKITGEYL